MMEFFEGTLFGVGMSLIVFIYLIDKHNKK